MTRPMRSKADWADDSSLYFRLKESLFALARGEGGWGDGAEVAFGRLEALTAEDFPEQHQAALRQIQDLQAACTKHFPTMVYRRPHDLKPKQREALVTAILDLYSAITRERARQNID